MKKQLRFSLLLFSIFSGFSMSGQYCTAGGNCGIEWITNVTFGAINQPSQCSPGGYQSYVTTAGTAQVEIGVPTQLSVTMNPDGNNSISAWIDWNNNGSFTDPGEEYIVVSGSAINGPHTLNITPPSGAAIGLTTMRVGMRWASAPAPCNTSGFGEYEDYRVEVLPECDLTLAIAGTDESCAGFEDGSATVTITGAVPPFTLTWSNGATTNTINNLPSGTYTAIVTDQECTDSISYTVLSPPNLGPEPISGLDTVINQPIQVYFIDAKGSWNYQWKVGSGGTIRQGVNTHVATVEWTTPGVHELTCVVVSQAGCIDSSFVDVYVNVAFSASLDAYESVKYYPNPVKNYLQIDDIPDFVSEIEVYSMVGERLLKQNVSNTPNVQLDLSALASGNYLLRIGDKHYKIIKTN